MRVKAIAPGKVILLGEHFVVHGSQAVLCAIDRDVTITMSELVRKVSIKSDLGSISVNTGTPINYIPLEFRPIYYIAEKVLKRSNIGGVRIVIDSRIPPGAGLGSSSACCVAAVAAATEFAYKITDRSSYKIEGIVDDMIEEVIETAILAERTIFPDTSGIDCMVSAYGGLGTYDGVFNKNEDIAYGRDVEEMERIEEMEDSVIPKNDMKFIIADSGVRHNTREMVDKVGTYKRQNPKEFDEMCNSINEMVQEIPEILVASDHKRLGAHMNKNHQYLREIGVSNNTLDEMVELGSTPYGAKITGAGGGGVVCAITDRATEHEMLSRYRNAGYDCAVVGIANDGVVAFV